MAVLTWLASTWVTKSVKLKFWLGVAPLVMAGRANKENVNTTPATTSQIRHFGGRGGAPGGTGSRAGPGLAGLERCWYQLFMSWPSQVAGPRRRWALCC